MRAAERMPRKVLLLLLTLQMATVGAARAQDPATVPTPRADTTWWMS